MVTYFSSLVANWAMLSRSGSPGPPKLKRILLSDGVWMAETLINWSVSFAVEFGLV